MKRKSISLLLILSVITIGTTACGNKLEKNEPTESTTDASTTDNGVTTNESWGSGYTVTEDGGIKYDATKDTDGGEDYANYLEWQWVDNESYKQAGCETMKEFVDTYAPGQGTLEAWTAYAQQNGADEIDGVWWIYYHGRAAGSGKSYAVNQETGERMEASPDAVFPNGGNFWGAGDEYEANWEAWILGE